MSACGSAESRAQKMMETAAFEERQTNFIHAAKIYRTVIEKYPETQAAREAARRLARIEKGDLE